MEFFRRYLCETCARRFWKIEQLMQHEQVVHGANLQYECRQCNVTFAGMEQMREHAKKFHSYKR